MGCRPASQQGAHAVVSAPGLPPSTCEAAPSFSLACASSSKPPRPGRCTFERFISDPNQRRRLTARRLVPRLRPRSFWRVPPRAPQRGASPTAERAGCPRVALPRASTDPPRQPTVSTEALFQSLRLPAQILSEDQAAEPRGDKSHARHADATGTQSSVFALRATPRQVDGLAPSALRCLTRSKAATRDSTEFYDAVLRSRSSVSMM